MSVPRLCRHHRRGPDVVLPDGDGGTQRIGDFAALRRWGVRHPYMTIVPQWDLLDLLAGAAAAEPTFRLRQGVRASRSAR